MPTNNTVSIESLLLANHAEQSNGLLYVSGGGWTTHTRMITAGNPPPLSHLGVAVIAAIPWLETNQNHNIIIELRDEDGNAIVNIAAQMNAGRAPGMRPGTIQYPVIALPMDLIFPRAGGYEILAQIAGVDGSERRWAFEVRDIQK